MCLENGLAAPAVCYHGRVFSEAFVVAPKYYPRSLLWQHEHVMRKDPLWFGVEISSGFVDQTRGILLESVTAVSTRKAGIRTICARLVYFVAYAALQRDGRKKYRRISKTNNSHIRGIYLTSSSCGEVERGRAEQAGSDFALGLEEKEKTKAKDRPYSKTPCLGGSKESVSWPVLTCSPCSALVFWVPVGKGQPSPERRSFQVPAL